MVVLVFDFLLFFHLVLSGCPQALRLQTMQKCHLMEVLCSVVDAEPGGLLLMQVKVRFSHMRMLSNDDVEKKCYSIYDLFSGNQRDFFLFLKRIKYCYHLKIKSY